VQVHGLHSTFLHHSDSSTIGIHGLVMLKTYRDCHPNASIIVLEKGTSLGGVWAKDRLYPGLHTNNHFQTYG
jgi:cation diffusion facilitator CzcD-associated flavoprotein CzcO